MMTSLDCAVLAVASLTLLVQLVAAASVGLVSDKNDPEVSRPTDIAPSEFGSKLIPGDAPLSPQSSTIGCNPANPSCLDTAVVTDTAGTKEHDVTVTSSAHGDNLSPLLPLPAQPISELPVLESGPSVEGQKSDCSSSSDGFYNDVTCLDSAGNIDQKTGKEPSTPSDVSATPTSSSADTMTSLLPLDKPSAPLQPDSRESTGGIMTSSTAVDNEYRYVDEEHEYLGIGGTGGMGGDVRGASEVDSEDDDMADYYDVVDYGRNSNNYNMTSFDTAAESSDLSAERTQMIVDERNRDDNIILSDDSTSGGNADAGKYSSKDFDESNNDQVAVNRGAPAESNGGTNDDNLWMPGVAAVDGAGRSSIQQQQQQAAASWFDTHGEFSAFVVYTWLAVASASLVIVIIMIRYRHEVSMAVQYVKNGYIHTKQRANDVVEEANDLLSNAQV